MNTEFIGTSVYTDLHSRLSEYAFPPLLASRLAAEQRWTPAYTQRVLAEYRRFLLLAVTPDRSVTPPLDELTPRFTLTSSGGLN